MLDPCCCNDTIVVARVTLAPRIVVVFLELFVENHPTAVYFLVLVLQTFLLSIGAPRKQIGIFEC